MRSRPDGRSFAAEQEAVRLRGDTMHGLTGAMWTEHSERTALRAKCGTDSDQRSQSARRPDIDPNPSQWFEPSQTGVWQ
jgi:hypothetical protein